MIIKTKFELEQEVWTMQCNKPIKLIVDTIQIFICLDGNKNLTCNIEYTCLYNNCADKFREDEIYATKEDLKNSLFG